MIGTLDVNEGIKSTLKASGRQYKIKRIDSSADNWKSIIGYFEEYNIRCAVIKLTGTTYEYLVNPAYIIARDKLLEHLSKVPHVIFAHETLLFGPSKDAQHQPEEIDEDDERIIDPRKFLHYPGDNIRQEVNNLLMSRELNLLPFINNAELTVMASSFITDAEEGLLFRIYVPTHRMWANETDRLVQLFRDYLTRVEKLSVRFDQHRTDRGIVYEFFSAAEMANVASVKEESLATQFQEFSQLLDLSMSDPDQAEEILKSKNLDPREVVPILTRYAKEAKRLQIDLKHEREQKVLAIRHKLESELVDILPADIMLDTVSRLVDSTVPPLAGITSVLKGDHIPLQLNAASGSTVTVNLKPQVVQAVNSIIAQEIEGDIQLTEMDRKLIELIREHACNREQELTSAVRELADNSIPQPSRLIAKQKLKAFLLQVGSKATDIGIGLLQAYLEKKMGLS